MKVMQMLNSIPVLEKLMTLSLPVIKAHKIYSLTKQINEQREFFINEEKKMIEKYDAAALEDGRIQFQEEEKKTEFLKEHNELLNFEVENLKPVILTLDDLANCELSANDIILLEDVIIIEE